MRDPSPPTPQSPFTLPIPSSGCAVGHLKDTIPLCGQFPLNLLETGSVSGRDGGERDRVMECSVSDRIAR